MNVLIRFEFFSSVTAEVVEGADDVVFQRMIAMQHNGSIELHIR